MGVLTKAVKIPAHFQDDNNSIAYSEFTTLYFGLKRSLREIKNKISTDVYLQMRADDAAEAQAKADKKKKTDDAKIAEEKFKRTSKNTMSSDMYHKYKDSVPLYSTSNLTQMVMTEVKHLTKHYSEVCQGVRTIDTFKTDQPLTLHPHCLKFEYTNRTYIAVVTLFSGLFKQEHPNAKNGNVNFHMDVKSPSLKNIVKRCISGEYKICASSLGYDSAKKEFVIALTYSFYHEANAPIDSTKVLGLDLGLNKAYYAATNEPVEHYEKFFDAGTDIKRFRLKTEAQRKELARQRAHCGEGSIGHGYTTRMKPVLSIGDRIAVFRDGKNNDMARNIVDRAVKMNCGVIQMEDLTGISKENKFLKHWTYYDLQTKIERKAELAGITVHKIYPAYTSKRCSCCGYIHPENRKTGSEKFTCLRCGTSMDADQNAARNISDVNIEETIQYYIETHRADFTEHELKQYFDNLAKYKKQAGKKAKQKAKAVDTTA